MCVHMRVYICVCTCVRIPVCACVFVGGSLFVGIDSLSSQSTQQSRSLGESVHLMESCYIQNVLTVLIFDCTWQRVTHHVEWPLCSTKANGSLY